MTDRLRMTVAAVCLCLAFGLAFAAGASAHGPTQDEWYRLEDRAIAAARPSANPPNCGNYDEGGLWVCEDAYLYRTWSSSGRHATHFRIYFSEKSVFGVHWRICHITVRFVHTNYKRKWKLCDKPTDAEGALPV